jgi:hypothetical protein
MGGQVWNRGPPNAWPRLILVAFAHGSHWAHTSCLSPRLGAPQATWPILCRRWRGSAVDPCAQLEQAGGRLPPLAQLTLPGEWAIGWPASSSSFAPSATPLVRLLLGLSGGAGASAPAVRVSLPTPSGPVEAVLDARVRARVERICAAAERAGWSAGLPPVELVACSGRSYAALDGWQWGSEQR